MLLDSRTYWFTHFAAVKPRTAKRKARALVIFILVDEWREVLLLVINIEDGNE